MWASTVAGYDAGAAHISDIFNTSTSLAARRLTRVGGMQVLLPCDIGRKGTSPLAVRNIGQLWPTLATLKTIPVAQDSPAFTTHRTSRGARVNSRTRSPARQRSLAHGWIHAAKRCQACGRLLPAPVHMAEIEPIVACGLASFRLVFNPEPTNNNEEANTLCGMPHPEPETAYMAECATVVWHEMPKREIRIWMVIQM
ncbi:hypothetical protein FIBSPDRAFT_948973 [Athelia psychrophila]|uniref:Uncharacterized protein n=1 Tax=Athelia psychrophila TaxID=1759441 RepID=A0A166QDC7_9AGAM|nr:hypothetical protein FIBSPDRAFT_948973 [Fibularhizoctonia sp. CBS 109695]